MALPAARPEPGGGKHLSQNESLKLPTMQTPPLELVFKNRDDWHAGLRRHILPLDCCVAEPQSFQCHAVVARLCGNTVAELRVDASRLVRRAADIDGGEDGFIKILWQLASRSRIQQGPNSALLEAGTWTICDPGREYTIELDRGARVLLLLVPRSQCPGWLSALNVLSARALPAGGPAYIAMAALAAMLRNVAHLDAESESTLHESVVALIERALAIEMGSRGLGAQPERPIHLPQVQDYILGHLGDTRLNVGRVASIFGVSRRSLYNIFAPSGVTPHTFIQTAKLDRACDLLNQPSSRHTSVAVIARQCGFADPAHFSRAFHARHGVAPTAWRGQGH
jgi:AraC family transcriptional regulator, positive regulator of tynA and feaB